MVADAPMERVVSEPAATGRSRRDWLGDAAVFVVAVGIGAASLIDPATGEMIVPTSVDGAIGALAILSLLWRRRYPVALLALVALANIASVSAAGAVIVLLYSVAARRPPRVVALAAAGWAATAVAYYALRPGMTESDKAWFITATVVISVFVLAWGVSVRAGGLRNRRRRDWAVDIAAIVLSALFAVTSAVDPAAAFIFPPWVDVGLGSLTALSLFWRRRYPVALWLLAVLLNPISASASGPLLVLLFTVAVRRPPAIALGAAVVTALTAPLYFLLRDPLSQTQLGIAFAFSVAFAAVAVALGMFVRARRQLVESLRQRARDAEANQAERVRHARDEERARIAREMHDVLGHRLSLLALHAGALEFRPDASAEEVSRTAGVIRSAAHDALTELRGAIGALRGVDVNGAGGPERPQPTLSDLETLLRECHDAGVRIDAHVRVDVATVPTVLGRNAYRIVQEGLTNARKHAPNARVELTVRGAPGSALEVEVRNPLAVGVGATSLPGAGTGLIGIRERVELAGGGVDRAGVEHGDWVLRARLPWPVTP